MFDKIADELAKHLKADRSKITMDTNIKTDLNADSLTIAELIFNLEAEYDIQIPDEVIEGLTTVGSLVNYLESINIK